MCGVDPSPGATTHRAPAPTGLPLSSWPLHHRPRRARWAGGLSAALVGVLVGGAVLASAGPTAARAVPASAVAAAGPVAGAGAAPAATDAEPGRPEVVRPVFGVSTEGAPAGEELQRLVSAVGRVPDEIMWFVAWGLRDGFPVADAARVRDLGATPVITWEPWEPALGADQSSIRMRSIAAGRHDRYVRRWARDILAFGTPVVLRFAHEVNGTWYPWSPGVDGTTVRDAVSAWRRVHDIFERVGATNAVFRWSPNVPFPGSTAMSSLWPGAGYVDEVALDGYNWAGWLPGTRWQSFSEVLSDGLAELASLTDLPVHAGETGTPERGPDGRGDKAAWVRGMFDTLRTDDRLAGFTWFDHDKEHDWRITSSKRSTEAFRESLAGY